MLCCGRDRDSCGETCDRFCPCFSIYPSICTVFVCLISACLFAAAFGAYAFIALRTSILDFDWPPEWFIVVNISFLALVAVVIMLPLSLGLWCVCSTYRRGVLFKSFFILALLLALLCLVACMVCSVLVIYGAAQKGSFFARQLETVWTAEIDDPTSTAACRVQKQLNCRGFEERDCQKDSPTRQDARCATRCRPEDQADGAAVFDSFDFQGCREAMSKVFIQWHAILLTGSSVAAILVIFATFITCGSITFEKEK